MSDDEIMMLMGDALRCGLEKVREELGVLMLLRASGNYVDESRILTLMQAMRVGYPLCDSAMGRWPSDALQPWLDFFKEKLKVEGSKS